MCFFDPHSLIVRGVCRSVQRVFLAGISVFIFDQEIDQAILQFDSQLIQGRRLDEYW